MIMVNIRLAGIHAVSIRNARDWFFAKAGPGALGKFDGDATHHMSLVLRPPASNHICIIVFQGLKKVP